MTSMASRKIRIQTQRLAFRVAKENLRLERILKSHAPEDLVAAHRDLLARAALPKGISFQSVQFHDHFEIQYSLAGDLFARVIDHATPAPSMLIDLSDAEMKQKAEAIVISHLRALAKLFSGISALSKRARESLYAARQERLTAAFRALDAPKPQGDSQDPA